MYRKTFLTGTCPNAVVAGNYTVDFLLTASNTVTLNLNVTTAGEYKIYSDYNNGMQFRDSGIFATIGVHTVTLVGIGRPQNPTTSQFMPQSPHGIQGCNFFITAVNTTLTASYTFDGAPAACSNVQLYGNYHADSVINGQAVLINVNVNAVGNYSVLTNSANGISFSASGVFTNTGPQSVYLIGAGTPLSLGSNTFIPQAQGISTAGCSFVITTN